MEGVMQEPNSNGRIIHITDYYSSANPGITTAITQLARYLCTQEWRTTILAVGKRIADPPEGAGFSSFPERACMPFWRLPKGMAQHLSALSWEPGQLFHIHGVWFASQWIAARFANSRGIPTVFTPNGMLEPWQWRKSRMKRVKKTIYWYSMCKALRRVDLIHAVTTAERDNLVRFFPTDRIRVIPNAIDLDIIDKNLTSCQESSPPLQPEPYLLFLGRLDPQKGLDILIRAFTESSKKVHNFKLLIVGPESNHEYAAALKRYVQEAELKNRVVFFGSAFGPEKWQLYRNAWAVCSASLSEGLSLVQLEAAACGVPILTTFDSSFSDLQGNGGMLVQPSVRDFARAIEQVCSWTETERNSRGRSLRNLVERRYSWTAVGPQYLDLYRELLRQYQ